ncbi:LysR family transcriptional regulator, partial [Burkholderia pseudomallei]
PSDAGYYLVAPDAAADSERFVALAEWLGSVSPARPIS